MTTPAAQPLRILHLEDSTPDHQLVQRCLAQSAMAFTIERVDTLAAFGAALQSANVDVVLADYALPGFTALDAWVDLQQLDKLVAKRPPFILVSGAIGEAGAVAAMKLGLSDYVLKDDLGKLPHVIVRALEVQDAHRAKEQANAELAASEKRLAAFAEHLQTTIEQERAAIAREIHDDIGGSLAAVKFDLAWLGRHSQDAGILEHVKAASDMVQHALGASQRIMMDLRPAILDQGLVPALEWLCTSFEKRSAIPTRFLSTAGDFHAIPKAVQLTAYRTAQEALTNITKYAQCSAVKIEFSDVGGVLTLEINDNGRGIAAPDLARPGGYGLKGLSERAKTVGGWLDVSSREGLGTTITLTVALLTDAQPGSASPHAEQEFL